MEDLSQLFNIVVLGDMNPRIHTPAWYRLIDLIDDEEMEESVRATTTMSIPPAAQVQLTRILIQCLQHRWEIRTRDANKLQRMKSITAKVFDELLKHTPVSAMGFNFDFQRPTGIAVGPFLAECLAKLPLDLSGENLLSGEMSIRRSQEDHTIQVKLRAASDHGKERVLVVENNYEYRFENKYHDFFNLADMIEARFDSDMGDAESRTDRILESIEKMAE